MRLIFGTVKSTQLQWLPVLANIASPKLRRETTTVAEGTLGHSCTNRCWIIPIKGPHPSTMFFSIPDAWTAAWSASLPVTGDLIVDPNVRPPGFDLRRHN
jgi:hypothetical protein